MELTPDGHYLVVDGRRWQATDPAIPEVLRQELVDELMRARRAVRTNGPRHHVNDAKVALGERGEPWWEPSADRHHARLAAALRALLRHRGDDGSCSPTELARVMGARVPDARAVVGSLAVDGVVRVLQDGREVDVATAHGRVQVRRGPQWPG